MCLGGKPDVKVEVPKPPPLPPPIPAPPPPKPPKTKPKSSSQILQRQDLGPADIRIGAAKKPRRQPSSSRPRVGGQNKDSLSIGSNQGLNI